jgi:hypothetical protein
MLITQSGYHGVTGKRKHSKCGNGERERRLPSLFFGGRTMLLACGGDLNGFFCFSKAVVALV